MSAVTKEIGGASNGGKRVIPANKASKWYPAEDIPALKKARKTAVRHAVLRESLKPGAVLIILAGRFRGKRVVLLKALEDGTLLVTGPFKVNGVPLRRVNAAYVIATSTVVDIASVDVSSFSAAYFAHEKKSKKEGEAEFFGDEEKKQKKVISEARIADQKAVDTALLAEIKKVPALKAYLASSFSLKKGDKPHLMKF
ncbi:ribosomal protein L6e-domain-containing protein [Lipomyces kononenkoae]